ncbi:SH3 domain-containing protein [Bacillus cereus]|uniref:SH3 domain-containing protein n=1 Tax=Bacillus cereus TaxID=1396 RepID=UPI000BF6ABA3|nr:SH3 domain-containing protein [Bacillus cereus]PFA86228.1 peptidase M23 [Bacillus cereus]
MKKILTNIVVASVTGGTFINAAQAQTNISPTDSQHDYSHDEVTQEEQVVDNKYTVNADSLRVRNGPSTSHPILGYILQGQSLQVIDETSEWYKINYNNTEAYVSKDYVNPKQVLVDTETLRIRTEPSTTSSISRLVDGGIILDVIGEIDGWYKIRDKNKEGYVSKDYVKMYASIEKSEKVTVQKNNGYIVNVSSLRMRTGPSLSHSILGVLNYGESIQVVGEVRDWYKVKIKDKFAYVSKDYVSREKKSTSASPQRISKKLVKQDGEYTVDADVLRVRTGPANYYPVIGGILKEQSLQVIGVENGWYKIKYKDATGFVSGEFVKFVKGASNKKLRHKSRQDQEEVPKQKPTQDQKEVPKQKPTQDQKEVPKQKPTQDQEEVPKQKPTQDQKEVPKQKPTQDQEEVPKQKPTQDQEEVPKQKPTQSQDQVPKQKPTQDQEEVPKQKPTQDQEQKPKQKPTQELTQSGFIKPAEGRYTSGFGKRGGQMHYGQDIVASGNVPIIAAADGEVIRSYYSESYGNAVFISHNINGKNYTTVYAHLSSRAVSGGQKVKQGQKIGIMGNTGQSEGQHLHFEIHTGEWNGQKSNAVDPKPYIS